MSKKCHYCGYSLPDECPFCLNCFTKNDMQTDGVISNATEEKCKGSKFIILLIIALLVIGLAVGIIAKTSNNNNTTTTTKPTTTAPSTSATTSATTTSTTTTTTEPSTTTSTTTTTTKATTKATPKFDYITVDGGIKITSYNKGESNVTVPAKIDGKKVVEIGSKAFANNSKIKTISFESDTIKLNKNSFYNLSSLKTLNLPSNTTCSNIASCISKCKKLQSVNIYSAKYKSENGIVFEGDILVYYPAGKTNTSYTIPYRVTKIANNAFNNNSYLIQLKFSKSENLNCNWENLFGSLPNLDTILIYPGTSPDLEGMHYFDGEIVYYE